MKKGKRGEASQYLSRAQALKKLQCPLADFRKLCILKGIYPRDPKRKPGGKDKTYFHVKDIRFLLHEPLLDKIMKQKTFMKKYKRLIGRKVRKSAIDYEQKNSIKYTLHHLVKERYPKFDDALRDLDDALSSCALFDTLPVDKRKAIPPETVQECERVMSEFMLYVVRERRLRKVFASIKGYYYQIDLNGATVTWLCPHRFSQDFPAEVDFKVLLTFVDLHKTIIKFVNYRLFTQAGLKYPPSLDMKAAKNSATVTSLRVEHFDDQIERKKEEDVSKMVKADFGDVDEVKAIHEKTSAEKKKQNVFGKCVVFIGREVPFDPLYFCLRACGAEVGWPREGSPFGEDAEHITHHIIDRPLTQVKQREGREYVQPQWVFDSMNEGRLLPISEYAPGIPPPPHLSPFVDAEQEGYVPQRRKELQEYADGAVGDDSDAESDREVADPEELRDAELVAEIEGKKSSDKVTVKTQSKKKQGKEDAKEEEARLKSMMTKKHKRMLLRINQRAATKDEKVQKLVTKKGAMDAKAAKSPASAKKK